MNPKLLHTQHEHCYWFEDEAHLFLVGASHAKAFTEGSPHVRMHMAIEAIDKQTHKIVKHRFAHFNEAYSANLVAQVPKTQGKISHARLSSGYAVTPEKIKKMLKTLGVK